MKGLAHSAQGWTAFPLPHGGPTLGNLAAGALNPERVASVLCSSSIPHVSLVEGDVVTPQQRAELLLKRSLAVVGFLRGNEIAYLFGLREAQGEDAITVLPGEIRQSLVSLLDPERGPPL